jgi:hypothetical protein
MDRSSAFFLTSLRIAERFLQTAVVIDDRAFVHSTVVEPVPVALEPPPTPETAVPVSGELFLSSEPTLIPVGQAQHIPDADPHGIDAEAVIRSFAQKGIVCSVLQRFPDENPAAEGESARRLLAPSDILVIDWQVHHTDGSDSSEETLRFLKDSVLDSSQLSPEQLRVIIVYTGAQDLVKVADKVGERLGAVTGLKPVRDGDFAYSVGACRIVVLGKFSRIRAAESKGQQVKDDADLASWATREFAAITAGLVSNVALSALAAIRVTTHRILTRFGPALDPAFLAHRAMLAPPAEGNSHLLPLIVAEIQAILEEKIGDNLLSDDTVVEWLETRPDPKSLLSDAPAIKTSEQARQLVREICVRGVKEHATFSLPGQPGWLKKLADGKAVSEIPQLTRIVGAKDDLGADERLEELMSLRARYGDKPPELALGTLLRSDAQNSPEYWLCLQPACDCYIRTGPAERAFPFLKLQLADAPFNLLAVESGKYVRLKWEPRPHHLRMFEFRSNLRSKAVSADPEGDAFFFSSVQPPVRFKWVGELKFPQAQRIAQALASEASRVGLTESEWLRRSGR